jgi:very-short-patch-repair endonuclease
VVVTARKLRKAMSMPQVLLWQELRQRPNGMTFRQQHPVGPYEVDFCCLSAKLVVEIDGFAHETSNRPARDEIRARFLNDNGYEVIRVSAKRVLADAVGTAGAIVGCGAKPLHHPAAGPPARAGED